MNHPAETMIEALTGSADTPCIFQVFDDSAEKDQTKAGYRLGRFAEVREWLVRKSAQGCGIFLAIQHFRGALRRVPEVDALHALFIDADDTPKPDFPGAPPTFAHQRSDIRWAYFWRLKPGEDVRRFRDAQRALATFYGTDPTVCGPQGVMRLPGFPHQKDPAHPGMYAIQAVESTAVYTIDELMRAHGIEPVSVRAEEMREVEPIAQTRLDDHTPTDGERAILAGLLAETSPGGRHHAALNYAIHAVACNLPPEEIEAALHAWFLEQGRRPMPREIHNLRRDARRGLLNGQFRVDTAGMRADLDFDQAPVPPAVDPGAAGRDAPPVEPARPWREVARAFPTLRPALVEGLLRRGEVMNLVAAPKCGKSWLAMGLAFAMSAGVPWLGHPVTQGAVLYVDNELHPETWVDRARILAALHPERSVDQVHLLTMRGRVTGLNLMAQEIIAQAQRVRASLIVLDAFYRFLPKGVSENDNADMTHLAREVDRIARDSGAAIVLVHHTSKGAQGDKAVTDVGAGASALARAADTHVVLREHESEGRVVFDAVTRSWPAAVSFVMERNGGVWSRVEGMDAGKLKGKAVAKAPNMDPVDATCDLVETLLPQRPTSRTEILVEAKVRGIRIAADVLRVRLDQLVEQGKAVRIAGANNTLMWGREEAPAVAGTLGARIAEYLLEHPGAASGEVAKTLDCDPRHVRRVRNTQAQELERTRTSRGGQVPGQVNGHADKSKSPGRTSQADKYPLSPVRREGSLSDLSARSETPPTCPGPNGHYLVDGEL